jgi:hypothetical protein
MRKQVGLIVLGVAAFDLGTVVVPARAADTSVDFFLKVDGISNAFNYHKFNNADGEAAKSCVAGKGTLVEFKGDKYCRTDKAAAATRGPATALPSSATPAPAAPPAGPATAAPATPRK